MIETARDRGYIVIVAHMGVDSPDLSVAQVRLRTEEGGHDGPEDKIRAQGAHSVSPIRKATLRTDRGSVFATAHLTRAEPVLPGVDPGGLRRRSGEIRAELLITCDRRTLDTSGARSPRADPPSGP